MLHTCHHQGFVGVCASLPLTFKNTPVPIFWPGSPWADLPGPTFDLQRRPKRARLCPHSLKECVCMYERACMSVCECDTGRCQGCVCTASIYKAPQDPGHPQSAQFSLFHLPLGTFLMLFAPTFHGKPPQPPSTAPFSFTFSPGVREGS